MPVGHRPRVSPAPCVDHTQGLALGHDDAVDPAHRRKGTDAAGEPAGKLLNLADLALGLGNVSDRHPVGGGGVDLVDILARPEQLQLVDAGGATRRPRRHPRLDRRPVGNDQALAGRCHQRRAQHTLKNVGDALAVRRHDLVPAHDSVAHRLGVVRTDAREVVDLKPERRRATGGSAASEHERAAHPVVLLVG